MRKQIPEHGYLLQMRDMSFAQCFINNDLIFAGSITGNRKHYIKLGLKRRPIAIVGFLSLQLTMTLFTLRQGTSTSDIEDSHSPTEHAQAFWITIQPQNCIV